MSGERGQWSGWWDGPGWGVGPLVNEPLATSGGCVLFIVSANYTIKCRNE